MLALLSNLQEVELSALEDESVEFALCSGSLLIVQFLDLKIWDKSLFHHTWTSSGRALSLRGERHQFTYTSTGSEDQQKLMYLARVFVLCLIYSITPVEDRSSPSCRPSWRA